jgi:hypothetical protein
MNASMREGRRSRNVIGPTEGEIYQGLRPKHVLVQEQVRRVQIDLLDHISDDSAFCANRHQSTDLPF